MNTTNHIRNLFLEHFKKNSHIIVPSSSLVPYNDPTLMFTNSGMVQFKNIFTGSENLGFNRATTSQKCVRAGGKHNDLDNVGYTARHHTFFEMLGNFSFGDYFKEAAIEYAWNFITKELLLHKDKLYVTIYHDDNEAYNIWHKITGFGDDKIIRINSNDNFWSMGDTGPCGPCSEIFFDHGEHIWGGLPGTPEQDGDRYVEIWNLVFMQYEQLSDGSRIKLPKPSIDTGMGLERVAAVAQKVHDNYDIDLFQNIINASAELSKTDPRGEHKISHRVLADHLRSACFLLADGVNPSNEGRGYVLRRIMRRAMRHANLIGQSEPFIHKLAPTLIGEMGTAYPELVRAQALILETLKHEEERFLTTLSKGLKLLEAETTKLSKGAALSGEVAFKLYDTYGFPLDLTKDILKKEEIALNEKEFETSMDKQRATARAAWSGSGEQAISDVWFNIYNECGATEFLGYEHNKAQAKILAIVVNQQSVEQVQASDTNVVIILNQTPFYGESGGQMGDIGHFLLANNTKIEITDTKKYFGKLIVHFVKSITDSVKVGDTVQASIDTDYRNKLRANHSATHLLHAALRNVLGNHVTQKGSLVGSEKLRFDFSHSKPIEQAQLRQIEKEVNRLIRENKKSTTALLPIQEAMDSGAMAMFGEKYDDEVRVITFFDKDEAFFSKELCGGTHVESLGDIGIFKIISESSIASGIRRIEAITGEEALNSVINMEKVLVDLSNLLTSKPEELYQKVQGLINDRKSFEKQLLEVRKDTMLAELTNKNPEIVNNINFVYYLANNCPAKELRNIADIYRKNLTNSVLILTSAVDSKIAVIISVSPDLTKQLSALELMQQSAQIIGGSGGGGKADLAQGGGTEIHMLDKMVDFIKSRLMKTHI